MTLSLNMIQIKKRLKSFISSDRNVRNGVPVFKGTRVPVYTILEHLSLGWTLKSLRQAFPSVKSESITKLVKIYSDEFK